MVRAGPHRPHRQRQRPAGRATRCAQFARDQPPHRPADPERPYRDRRHLPGSRREVCHRDDRAAKSGSTCRGPGRRPAGHPVGHVPGGEAMSERASLIVVRITAAIACAFGFVMIARSYAVAVRVFPGATVLALVLELPLVLAGFWLLRLLRPVRAPACRWSAAAVAWGMAAATGCALLANQALQGIWAKTAGLGFQVAENFTYSVNAVPQFAATNPPAAAFLSAADRISLTGQGSHWAMTAVGGAGIGFLAARGRRGGWPAAGLLLTAMAMHWWFDSPLLGPPVPALGTAFSKAA